MSAQGFIPICADADLREGQLRAVEVDGRKIIVCRGVSGVHALDDLCTHNGVALNGGKIRKNGIACPMHGARFDLETGECLAKALGCPPLVTHRVRIENGQIEVELSDLPVQQPLA